MILRRALFLFQVGMDKQSSQDTRLMYCTTGVLLQKLISQKHMNNYTHVILDEVYIVVFMLLRFTVTENNEFLFFVCY